MNNYPGLVIALVVLAGIAIVVGQWAGMNQWRDVVVVSARAVVQLFAVAFVIKIIFETAWLAPIYLTVMVTAASYTSSRRLRKRGLTRCMPTCAVAIVAGAAVTAVVVGLTGALPADIKDLVPFAAQLIGGAMTATTLAGLRLIDDAGAGWATVESWLAIGAGPRDAVAGFARTAAARALVPALDQTRNVGLVVLPGAFVGLLLGGATPLQAGRLQLLVLVGLIATETVAAVIVTQLLSAQVGLHKPAAES